jgi:hypothetical protein
MTKLQQLEERLREFGLNAYDMNVPIGIIVGTESFYVKFSLSPNLKQFASFKDAIEFIITYEVN